MTRRKSSSGAVDWNVLAPYFSVPGTSRVKGPAEVALAATLASERGKDASAMRKAKKLAAEHGVEIDRDGVGAWWVSCAAFQDEHGEATADDPCEGSHFCNCGREVLQTVEEYVAALAAKKE